jgi:hypothetical protein
MFDIEVHHRAAFDIRVALAALLAHTPCTQVGGPTLEILVLSGRIH